MTFHTAASLELDSSTEADFTAHALRESPNECCGLIVDGRYWPCRNIAAEPTEEFRIAPEDYRAATAAGTVQAICHSHVRHAARPSPSDIVGCDASGLPWLIINPHMGAQCVLEPSGQPMPLIGRPWVWGAADCWSLVRDWFQQERGITLPDWDRPDTPEEFQAAPMFDRLWEGAGFRRVTERPQVGDVALMSIGGPGLNHVGVFVENGRILHHLRGRLSRRDLYGGWLQSCTGRLVRYAGHRE